MSEATEPQVRIESDSMGEIEVPSNFYWGAQTARSLLHWPRAAVWIVLAVLAYVVWSVLVASSEDSGVQAGAVLKERLTAVGGKGGGSPGMAQGSVPPAELDAVVKALTARTAKDGGAEERK